MRGRLGTMALHRQFETTLRLQTEILQWHLAALTVERDGLKADVARLRAQLAGTRS